VKRFRRLQLSLHCSLAAFVANALIVSTALGQTPPTAQDPLMSMMMSQPKVDLSAPIVAIASFDPPTVRPGQKSIYRVTFNALEQMVEWPATIAAPPGLSLSAGAHGQIMQPTSTGTLQPRTTFNSRAVASATGQFTLPGFVVQVNGQPVSVPPARLEVVPVAPALSPFSPRLQLEVSKTNLFIGEPVSVRILLPGSAGVVAQAGPPVQFPGQGFLVDQASARQRFEMRAIEGTNLPSYIYETVVIPIDAGTLPLSAQAHTAGNFFGGPIILSGPGASASPTLYTLVESDPVDLHVRPLPMEGRLPGFAGAIGRLTLEPSRIETNALRVGEPVKLTVVVRGEGPTGRLVPPPPPKVRDWQIFPAAGATPVQPTFTPGMSIAARLAAMGNLVGFTFTLVPLVDSVTETPAIPFSYFDPETQTYIDLSVPPVPVSVAGRDALAADARALLQTGGEERPAEPVLGSLARSTGWSVHSLVPIQQRAWFPLAQLAPAAAFIGLWFWDRRRRFLERNPEVVWRRRARRTLRRERGRMRRAAGRGDSPAFAAAALDAIRAACAPDFQAEPRALIGSDVLLVIRETDRSLEAPAGEPAVRRLFESTDASRFGAATAADAPLLGLRPELEKVLERLEARL
jgi:hypothetical protein